MKVAPWIYYFALVQPANLVGDVGKNCLGNALKMTWLDWTKPTLPIAGQGESTYS